jgi:hypothetical protein
MSEFHLTLVFGAILAFTAAAVYAFVGLRILDRRLDPAAGPGEHLAARLFAVYWCGLAAYTSVNALAMFLVANGIVDPAIHNTLFHLGLLLVCLSLWGLLFYLLFLFTGRRRLLYPLTAYYVGFYVLLQYYIALRQPVGVEAHSWHIAIVYVNDAGPFFAGLLLLLVLPQIIGAIAYFTFFFRFQDATLRWRVALVSGSIIVWFGASLVGGLLGLREHDWWHLTTRLIGLMAAIVVYIAYHPPAWVRQRFGVAPLGAKTTW